MPAPARGTAQRSHTWLVMLFKMALRNLLRQRRRTFTALVAVGFGSLCLVLAVGFIEWMFLDFREAMIESNYGHLQVSRPGYQENGRADPAAYLLEDDSVAAAIAASTGVRAVTPRLALTGLISREDSTLSFMGEGIDPTKDMTGDRALRILAGRRLTSSSAPEVLVGEGLARQLDVQVGDSVVLMVNTFNGGIQAKDARVAGVFASVSKAYDDSSVLLPIQTARALLRTDGAHTWLVYLDRTEDTTQVAATLRRSLDPTKHEVKTWDELAEFYQRAVALLREQLAVVRIIIVAIILLSITNTMLMTVMERTSEIGTVMALGVRSRRVMGQFMTEGGLIGLTGGLAGVLLAILVGHLVGALGIEMPPPPAMSRGYMARVLIDVPIALEAIFVSAATTMLASLYPSWRASRLNIVDAIRNGR